MTVEKPKPKQLLRPITTGAGSAMNQSQCLAITWNSLEAREKSRVRGAIGFVFDSHWLKNWLESFKPITKRSMQSQSRNYFRQSFENCSNDISLIPLGLVHSNRDSARKASEAGDISSRELTHPLGLKKKKRRNATFIYSLYHFIYVFFYFIILISIVSMFWMWMSECDRDACWIWFTCRFFFTSEFQNCGYTTARRKKWAKGPLTCLARVIFI